jgi:hypothetical protein
MKKSLAIASSVVLLLAGCGRQAVTLPTYAPGDTKKSCKLLLMETKNLQSDMKAKWSEKNQQLATNIGLGVAGAFLLVPWFFMDLSDTEKTEYESYKRRYDYLKLLMIEKECKDEIKTLKAEEESAKQKAKEIVNKQKEK